MAQFLFFIGLLTLGYFIGTYVEKKHYRQIIQKEKALLNFPVANGKFLDQTDDIVAAQLVCGSVVISLDYFKRFLAGLRNLFGGNISSYESLLDRGRREAIIRMKEIALLDGFDMILNMRFETSSIGQVTGQKGSVGCFEVLVYGTAIKVNNLT